MFHGSCSIWFARGVNNLERAVCSAHWLNGYEREVKPGQSVKQTARSEAFARWAFLTPAPTKIPGICGSYARKQPNSQMPENRYIAFSRLSFVEWMQHIFCS